MPPSKAVTAAHRTTASAPTPALRRNTKRQPSVSFQIETPNIERGEDEDKEDGEEQDDEEIGDESVVDMLSILQEYQKKKSSKSSSRAAALEAKKKTIRDTAYAQISDMKAAGATYINDVKAQIDALQAQEVPPDDAFVDIAALFGHRSNDVETCLETLVHLLTELSPARAEIIEQNSANLHSHSGRFAVTRKRAMKKARRDLHSGMEKHKLATDAQAYIKHYKHLV